MLYGERWRPQRHHRHSLLSSSTTPDGVRNVDVKLVARRPAYRARRDDADIC